MTSPKAIVIGAGVAGLSTASYLQMNGYDTEIVEMHSMAGGLCTGWKRGDYIFDGCVHWIVGSAKGHYLYDMWNELIDMTQIKFIYHSEFLRVEDKKGNGLHVYADIDRLEEELLSKAPDDKKLILQFTGWVRKLKGFRLPVKPAEHFNLFDKVGQFLRLLPMLPTLRECSRLTLQDYADRCKTPILKSMFETMFVPQSSLLFMVLNLGWMSEKVAGYPVGGSLEFVRHLESGYRNRGGNIRFNSKVTEIQTDGGRATGVKLADGTELPADVIVSGADGYDTLYRMLNGQFVNDTIDEHYAFYKRFPSLVYVSIGLKRSMSGEPHYTMLPLVEPIEHGDGTSSDRILSRIVNFDPVLVPSGKTTINTLMLSENADYWVALRTNDPEKYAAEKNRLARDVIKVLEMLT